MARQAKRGGNMRKSVRSVGNNQGETSKRSKYYIPSSVVQSILKLNWVNSETMDYGTTVSVSS